MKNRLLSPLARGVTLVECILLLMIVSIAAVGTAISMGALVQSPKANDQEEAVATAVTSELEVWRATPFATLATAAAGAGTITSNNVSLNIAGVAKIFPRKITIKQMDPNNPATNASPQADFIQVQVTIGSRTATLWVTQP